MMSAISIAALITLATAEPAVMTDQANRADGADRQSPDEIIVYGRRDSERYRLPSELREAAPDPAGRWRDKIDRDFACQDVGPLGCGSKGLPIITLRSDGTIQIGQAGGED